MYVKKKHVTNRATTFKIHPFLLVVFSSLNCQQAHKQARTRLFKSLNLCDPKAKNIFIVVNFTAKVFRTHDVMLC